MRETTLLPYLSLYLPCISPVSPLHLPYISPVSPQVREATLLVFSGQDETLITRHTLLALDLHALCW